MLRLVIAVFITAIAVAILLPRVAALLPATPTAEAEFLTVVVPSEVMANEPFVVLAGIWLPQVPIGYRVRVCREGCWTARRGTLPGNGVWWGRVAQLSLEQPGDYEVTLYLTQRWGHLGDRSVASHGWRIGVK